ncbi:hypothetical protein B9Q04_16775 [Candidatus Marsarchaeota G2 archaeon BE_D]|jgi:hypothetical protein|uniref:Uncharacterized protein n=1 Tax=Candidatus Marsarchaeota G2 archaeon BE_D TaxID=1978158 RepID=A0A2R6C5X6_9ARCH|nr:MAG: hypothetical protein B9Q04_16775 [Candidatus Marsarchaeota G2 archaeon BE_D]
MVNNTTVKIDSCWIETADGSVFNQTFILPILALQVPALNEEANLRDPSGQGIWRIKVNTTTNSDIVTNYVSDVSNPAVGFSYNLSMTTLDVTGITSAFKNRLVNGEFYLFLPQMLPPNQLPQSTQDPMVIEGGGGGPLGGSLKLLEKDNPQASINLWYLQVNLFV